MPKQERQYCLLAIDALPEAMRKVLEVKRGLKRGQYRSVNQACQNLNLSRSAFYKYREAVIERAHADSLFLLDIDCLRESGELWARLWSMLAESKLQPCSVHLSDRGLQRVRLSLQFKEATAEQVNWDEVRQWPDVFAVHWEVVES